MTFRIFSKSPIGKQVGGAGKDLLLLLLAAASLFAQQDVAGKLKGRVEDPSGAIVAGAEVTARNNATGIELTTKSTDDGSYNFPTLPPGDYSVTIAAPGFREYVSPSNVVAAAKTSTLFATLTIGSTSDSIVVQASATSVDTASPTLQDNLTERQLTALPVLGRDARNAVELTQPGVVQAENGNGNSRVRVNGQRGSSNNYQVDGTEAVEYLVGNAAPLPAIENLQEYSVITNAAGAEYGTSAGSQVTTVIKSGTNQLHAIGWAYLNNGAWNANSWEGNRNGVSRPSGSQRWFGGNIGGPVYIPHLYDGRNKTFWFFSRETTNPASQALQQLIVPTAAERAGDFSSSTFGAPKINGVTTPRLNPANFSPMARALLGDPSLFPLPNGPNGRYTWLGSRSQEVNTTILKLDQQIGSKHRVFASAYRRIDNSIWNPLLGIQFGAPTLPNEGTSQYENSISTYALNYTWTISPNMLNTFIVGANHFNSGPSRATENPNLKWARLGSPAVPDGVSAGEVGIFVNGWGPNGFSIWGNYNNPNPNHQVTISDSFTWIKGKHTVKAGGYVRTFHDLSHGDFNAGGNFTFSAGNVGSSGNPFADFLLGQGASFTQNAANGTRWSYPARELYLQDQYRITQRLTANLGIRWVPYFGFSNVDGTLSAYRSGQQSVQFPNAPVGLVVPGDSGISNSTYSTKWTNLGPRIGLAYDLSGRGKMVVRAGYGIHYDYQNLAFYGSSGAPYSFTYSPAGVAVPVTDRYLGKPAPFPYTIPTPGSQAARNYIFPTDPFTTYSFSPDFNAGRIHQYNATFEWEPISNWVTRIGYVGTRGTHLTTSYDLNNPVFRPGASTYDNLQARRPNPRFQNIFNTSSDANSRYDSLQIALNKRFAQGFTLIANYTLSRSTDSGDSSGFVGSNQANRDPYNRSLDYGLSSFDQTHILNVTYNWELPFFKGSPLLVRSLLGGWVWGGNLTAASGQALTIRSPANFNAGSSAFAWANYVGGSVYGSHADRNAEANTWINRAAFCPANATGASCTVDPAAGVSYLALGNSQRGQVRGPSRFLNNMSLTKRFVVSERWGAFSYNITAYNVFNHTVLANPNVNVTDGNFGQISSSLGPRTVQISLHYQF